MEARARSGAWEGRTWQVDLHMIFFALLAIVSILCDWKAICAAAH